MTNKGFHISIDNLEKNIIDVKKSGGNSIQIFAKDPFKSSNKSKLSDEYIKLISSSGMHVFIHSSYTINLLKKTVNNKLNKFYIDNIVDDLLVLGKLISGGGTIKSGVVLHVGTGKDNIDDKIITLVEYLRAIFKEYDSLSKTINTSSTRILIENRAKAGNLFPYNVDEMILISQVINGVPDLKDRVGFCYDTCHDFNTINILQKSDYKVMDGKVIYDSNKQLITIEKNLQKLIDNKVSVDLVHFNDAIYATKDEHADLLCGMIRDVDLIGVAKICKKYSIPMIIERIKSTYEDKEKMIKAINIFTKD